MIECFIFNKEVIGHPPIFSGFHLFVFQWFCLEFSIMRKMQSLCKTSQPSIFRSGQEYWSLPSTRLFSFVCVYAGGEFLDARLSYLTSVTRKIKLRLPAISEILFYTGEVTEIAHGIKVVNIIQGSKARQKCMRRFLATRQNWDQSS